jgi:hypothetical protein
MSRFAARFATVVLAVACTLALAQCAGSQEGAKADQDKSLDVRSSLGDAHLGHDADARSAGFPLYPGARLKLKDDEGNRKGLNMAILTQAFGMKVVAAEYESDDAPTQIVDFYREKLKRYGPVLECHRSKDGVHADADNDMDRGSKELKCEGDNTGPITELKVGTENNQHLVVIEASPTGKGSTFGVVYLQTRGKQSAM